MTAPAIGLPGENRFWQYGSTRASAAPAACRGTVGPSALGGMFWGSVPWGDVCRVAAALAPGYANCRAFGPDEWRVASGERRVASGEWRVASGEWRGRPIERSCLGANGSALATVFRSCGIGVLEDWFRCPMVDMNCRSTIRRREWKAIGYPVVVSKPSVHRHEALPLPTFRVERRVLTCWML